MHAGIKIPIADGKVATSHKVLKENIMVLEPTLTAYEFVTRYFDGNFLYIIDEFDRVSDNKTKEFIVDLIKSSSDLGTSSKIILIGVADTATDLTGKHQSMGRSIRSIHVKPLKNSEIQKILSNGLGKLNISASEEVTELVSKISNGLPYYGQLIGSECAKYSFSNSISHISLCDFLPICSNSIDGIMDYVSEQYSKSVPLDFISYVSVSRRDYLTGVSDQVVSNAEEISDIYPIIFEILYMATSLSVIGEITEVSLIADDITDILIKSKELDADSHNAVLDVLFEVDFIENLLTLGEEEHHKIFLPYELDNKKIVFTHPYLRSYAFMKSVKYLGEGVKTILNNKKSNKPIKDDLPKQDFF